MRQSVSFTVCPECKTTVGSQGLPGHRKAQHGVTTERRTPAKRSKRLTLEERLAQVAALNQEAQPEACPVHGGRSHRACTAYPAPCVGPVTGA